jgi:hypothetical protein
VTTAALSSLTEAGGRQQGLDRSNSCPSARHRRSSDGHDITPAGCQDLSGCHIGMYLGRQLSPARHVALCYTLIVHLESSPYAYKRKDQGPPRGGWPRGDEDGTSALLGPLASLSRVDACNPLLQAHLSHAGLRPPRSLPPLCSPTRSTHLGWGTRHSLVGQRDPWSRNADKMVKL